MKSKSLLLIFLALFQTLALAKEQIRVLMIGNSYTSSGSDSQRTSTNLEGFFEADSEIDADVQLSVSAGKTLIWHWDNGTGSTTARGKIINGGPWDYVVLQEQSQLAGFNSYANNTDFTRGVDNFIPLIRSVGAKPILMSTWGRDWGLGSGVGGTKEGSREIHLDHTSFAYSSLAHKWSIKAAPCGEAVEFFERDSLVPYSYLLNKQMRRDGSHLNSRGAYLAASAIYHTMTGKDPGSLNFAGPVEGSGSFLGLAAGEAKTLSDSFTRMLVAYAADSSLPELDTFSNGNHPVPFYPNPDPSAIFVGDSTPEDKTMTVDMAAGTSAGDQLARVQATSFSPITVPFNNNSSDMNITSVVKPTSSMTYSIQSGNDDGAFSINSSGVVRLTQNISIPVPRVLHLRATDSNNWYDEVVLIVKQTSVNPPVLSGKDIVDDQSVDVVAMNSVVTYTVDFSEAMNATTVNVSDFSNKGTSALTVNSVTQLAPNVFRVVVTPTSSGTLQLRVPSGAVLKDLDNDTMDTSSEILDETVIIVELGVQTIPNVVGQTQATAAANILAANLSLGEIFLQSDSNNPVGTVIAQSSAAGATAEGGSKVNLVVSNGTTSVIAGITRLDFKEGVIAVNGDTTLLSGYNASAADKLVVVLGSEGNVWGRFNEVTYRGVALTEAAQVQETQEIQKAAIFYLDNPGAAGDLVVDRGSLTSFTYSIYLLKGTAPGVGSFGSSLSNSVNLRSAAPGSLVIAGFSNAGPNGGNGGGYPNANAPLTKDNQTDLKIGNRYVTFGVGSGPASAIGVNQTYSCSGVNSTDLVATVAAEFMAATQSSVPISNYVISYNGNGNTGGSPPSAQTKTPGVNLSLANKGSLTRTNYTFTGWNTAANGNGTDYSAGGTYTANLDVTLYAQWYRSPTVDLGEDLTVDFNGGSAIWSPNDLNAKLWLDANDATSITQIAGRVSQWNDKSGNSRHISQTIPDSRPSYSAGIVAFDGANDYLWNSSPFMYQSGELDVYVVGAINPTSDDRLLCEGSSNSNKPLYAPAQTGRSNGSAMSMYIRNDSNAAQASQPSLSATGAFGSTLGLYQWRDTGSVLSGRVNAGSSIAHNYTRSGTLTMNRFSLGAVLRAGAVAHMGADVREVVVTSNLSDEDRVKMEGYLAHKWDLEGNLPADHPYKATAPGGSGAVVNLNGNVSNPGGGQFSTVWSVVSGPGTVTFGDATSIDTTASFSEVGTYVLRLTVNDGVNTSAYEVNVVVNESIAPEESLEVTAEGGLISTGSYGGPFGPSSKQYTLTNTGDISINWTASKTASWVSLSSTSGSIAAGASTTVTVSINSGANTLVANSYSDTVAFTNTSNGQGALTRNVSLTIVQGQHTVSYNGNGNTGGSSPSAQTKIPGVNLTLANKGSLTKTGYTFTGWNTAVNGTGSFYSQGGSYTADVNVTLYAQWNSSQAVDAGEDQTINFDGGSVAWTPANLNSAVWLDANDASTITQTSGKISQWNDKSGNNRHATQTSAANRPTLITEGLNSKNVVNFDGANGYFDIDLDSLAGVSHSSFIVTKTTHYKYIYGSANPSSGANSLHVGFLNDTYYRLNYWGNGFSPKLTANFETGANLLNFIWKQNVSKQILANGKSESANTSAGVIGTMAGGGRLGKVVNRGYYGGDISEFIIITGEVSISDREKMEGYLAHKWGLEANLSANHPYKAAGPGGNGAIVNLDATVSGQAGDTLTTAWSVVSGPGSVTFGDASAIDTTATFSETGTYVLRLTADDTNGTVLDEVTITVNGLQTVDAGDDQTVSIVGGSGDWTPADLNSALWLDANDASTITQASGKVSQWSDKSGNNNHATQSNSSKSPTTGTRTIGGKNIIVFPNVSNESLTIPSINIVGKEVWATFVCDDYSTSSFQMMLGGEGNTLVGVKSSHQKLRLWKGANPYSKDTFSGSTVAQGSSTVAGWLAHTNTKKFSVNGVLEPTTDNYNSGALNVTTVGRGQYAGLDGAIGEIIITSGVLSLDDRQRMEGYLAHKWGQEANLPANHPYKAVAPSVSGGNGSAVVSLDGTVTDTDVDTHTTTWSVTSGPGPVSFGDSAAIDTTATFTQAGTYALRLSITGNLSQTFDEVTIAVENSTNTQLKSSLAFSQTVELTTNVLDDSSLQSSDHSAKSSLQPSVTVSPTTVEKAGGHANIDVVADTLLQMYTITFERPKLYQNRGYFYRLFGAENSEGKYELLDAIKPNITSLDSVTEQVEYLIPFGLYYKVFKIESNDSNLQEDSSKKL